MTHNYKDKLKADPEKVECTKILTNVTKLKPFLGLITIVVILYRISIIAGPLYICITF